jgi:hypothetical protein
MITNRFATRPESNNHLALAASKALRNGAKEYLRIVLFKNISLFTLYHED